MYLQDNTHQKDSFEKRPKESQLNSVLIFLNVAEDSDQAQKISISLIIICFLLAGCIFYATLRTSLISHPTVYVNFDQY